MRLFGRGVTLLCLVLSASAARAASGQLHVDSVDGFGKPVAAEIQVFQDGKQIRRSFGESADFKLERGTYRVTAEQEFRTPEIREVSLTSSKLKVAIASKASSPTDNGSPAEEYTVTLWVKWVRECAGTPLSAQLSGVYWQRSEKMRVNPNGYATFEGWEPGLYQLTVTDVIGKRTTKQFRLEQNLAMIPLETTSDCQIR